MGGDDSPAGIIDGALVAARHLQVALLLVGSRDLIQRQLSRHPRHRWLDIEILDTPDRIEMDEPAAAALRRKPRASIRLARTQWPTGGPRRSSVPAIPAPR